MRASYTYILIAISCCQISVVIWISWRICYWFHEMYLKWVCDSLCMDYMSLTCWFFVTYLHPCMLGYILNIFITCINLVGWLQELIDYVWLHAIMHICNWFGISYAYCWLHLAMCTMEWWCCHAWGHNMQHSYGLALMAGP